MPSARPVVLVRRRSPQAKQCARERIGARPLQSRARESPAGANRTNDDTYPGRQRELTDLKQAHQPGQPRAVLPLRARLTRSQFSMYWHGWSRLTTPNAGSRRISSNWGGYHSCVMHGPCLINYSA